MNSLKWKRSVPFGILIDNELTEEGSEASSECNKSHVNHSECTGGRKSVVNNEETWGESCKIGKCVSDVKVAESVSEGEKDKLRERFVLFLWWVLLVLQKIEIQNQEFANVQKEVAQIQLRKNYQTHQNNEAEVNLETDN